LFCFDILSGVCKRQDALTVIKHQNTMTGTLTTIIVHLISEESNKLWKGILQHVKEAEIII